MDVEARGATSDVTPKRLPTLFETGFLIDLKLTKSDLSASSLLVFNPDWLHSWISPGLLATAPLHGLVQFAGLVLSGPLQMSLTVLSLLPTINLLNHT